MQDVLGLGSEHRMNRPGEAEGNWAWRLEPDQLRAEDAERLRGLAEASGRAQR
jgi:4-alpha-glucanotransferase